MVLSSQSTTWWFCGLPGPLRLFCKVFQVCAVPIVLAVGCLQPGGGPGVGRLPDDSPMAVVIARVNTNSRKMDFLVRGGGVTARGEYVDGDRRESFELHGTLLFRRPRRLYLKLSHVLGTVEAGSDGSQVWFRGPEEWMREDTLEELPFRPDRLADVLGLGLLPIDTRGPRGPMMLVAPDRYQLFFQDRLDNGQWYTTHRIDIDRYAPYLVRSIVFFEPGGHPVMQADLSDYRLIMGSEVWAPHRIRVDWLPDRGWMVLTLGNMKRFDKPAAEARFAPQPGSKVWNVKESDLLAVPALSAQRTDLALSGADSTSPAEATSEPP